MTFVKCFFYMTYNMSRNLYFGIFMKRESLQPIQKCIWFRLKGGTEIIGSCFRQARRVTFIKLDRIICLLCVYICNYIFPFNIIWTLFFFSVLNRKKINKKCPNNKKEIYNDKYKHTRDKLFSLSSNMRQSFISHSKGKFYIWFVTHKQQTILCEGMYPNTREQKSYFYSPGYQ